MVSYVAEWYSYAKVWVSAKLVATFFILWFWTKHWFALFKISKLSESLVPRVHSKKFENILEESLGSGFDSAKHDNNLSRNNILKKVRYDISSRFSCFSDKLESFLREDHFFCSKEANFSVMIVNKKYIT